jgi:glycosyltransferase involved in cell wall biosynthesis
VIRGSFGSSASLATVNDGLAGGLEDLGATVHHRPPGGEPVRNLVPGIAHSWPHDFSPVTQGPTVMVIPWEYGAPPAEWVRNARAAADRVWVPSEYVRERFVAAGLPAGIVEVVPNGFDPDRFSPDGPAMALPSEASCVFLFVGGTIWRKGIDLLLAAWEEAFGSDDDVALVIKDFGTATWYRGQTSQSRLQEFAARDDVAPILYLDQEIPAREMASLYRAADVLVAPYRGEGFCLPALEAMACGVPVIHTGTGPTGEFVPGSAGWALGASQVALPNDVSLPELAGEGHVQEVDHAELVGALRQAAADAEDRKARGRAAASHAASNYTWTAVATRAQDSLDTLAREALPAARLAYPEGVERRPEAMLVLYAPDWSDEARWAATLNLWAEWFVDTDPVTLAVHCGDRAPDELAQTILQRLAELGRDPEALPDLMLCAQHVDLNDIGAAADAVLVDHCDIERPELVRRALRVVTADADEVSALRATIDELVAVI